MRVLVVAVVPLMLLRMVGRFGCPKSSAHIRWRCERAIEVGVLWVGVPVRSCCAVLTVPGEGVSELYGGVGIHVVRLTVAALRENVLVDKGGTEVGLRPYGP